MFSTARLLDLPLFKQPWVSLTQTEQLQTVYRRAREIGRTFNFTPNDVVDLSPKFWAFHKDNICPFDAAAFTLVAIQCNLVAGTLAPFARDCNDHAQLLERILKFDVNAQFLLTELGHGLDARNLETTATLMEDGSFDLHTPHYNAAKYMPPTSPMKGFPRVSLVFARVMVEGEDRGLRPFVVWLNDGESMAEGVTSRTLPRRAGSKILDHSITTFDHVKLPPSSLLGFLETPRSERLHFLSIISRVSVGTLALSMTSIPMLKRSVFVAGKYSIRRKVGGSHGSPVSIISFRTQHAPILHTLAQIAVLEAWASQCEHMFCDGDLGMDVRHGVATAFKAVAVKATQSSLYALAERVGAQGLYEHNHIIESQLESRGTSIAEGDTLTLCIRLASELLQGRYGLPPQKYPTSLLSRHESGVFDECRILLQGMSGGHRSEEFNRMVLPKCQFLVESAGQRMAYDAAKSAGIPAALLDAFEASCVLLDSAWYVESIGLSRKAQFDMEANVLDSLLPHLDELLDGLGVERYCTAPIVSEAAMRDFNMRLPTHWTGVRRPFLERAMI